MLSMVNKLSYATEFRLERGLKWPASDRRCAPDVFDRLGDLDAAYRHCRNFRVAVQAGGNCGVWPQAMASRFEKVHTFEPDLTNYECLCVNVTAGNVTKIGAALGECSGTVGMILRLDNVGAHQIDGTGSIPMVRLDDFELKICDLIYLDIEGYELPALRGAYETIGRCRPTIAVEDKGLSLKYGVDPGEVVNWVCNECDYRVAERIARDVIMVPQ